MLRQKALGTTFSENISALIQTKPNLVDSDDDLTTADQIAVKDNSDGNSDDLEIGKFRKLNIEFLDADDAKYSGKKSSRSEVDDAFGDDSSDVESTEFEDAATSKVVEKADEDEDSDSATEENDSEIGSEEESGNDVLSDQEDIEQISSKVTTDIDKGKAIKNQLLLWDNLLECRIKFQKCLLGANQLPHHTNFQTLKQQGGEELKTVFNESKKSISKLLNSLLELQQTALDKNEEFVKSLDQKSTSDEEISSDDDNSHEAEVIVSPKKKRKITDFSSEINERHLKFRNFQNATIQKWNDKTRIGQMSSKDFNAFEQSTLKQIEHVLSDKQRLIRRTQMKRSNYQIIGELDEASPAKQMKLDEATIENKGINSEIFDDDDFYHQLLRELLERKSSDVTDPVQLSRQWIQLQKARSKMKKAVDTRASKGRKVRFLVHQKLVNFMMPIEMDIVNDVSRQELCNSLFGKRTL